MGRGKLSMQLIEKDKARMVTYQKRKKGLLKKVEEFSTLCGVPTCLIIVGPKMNNRPTELEFWPRDKIECMKVINLYKERASFAVRGVKSQNLFDFFANRKKKLEEKVAKLHKANFEAKFPCGWDERLKNSSDDQLKVVLGRIESVLEVVRRKIDLLKEEQALFQDIMELEGLKKQLKVPYVRQQIDFQLPSYCPPDHHHQAPQVLPVDYLNHMNKNPMMMMNGGDLMQFGSTSGGNVNFRQPAQPIYVDPMAAMLENPRGSMCLYGSSFQPLPSFEQLPVLPSFSSQMQHASQFNLDFFRDSNQSGNKGKRR